MKRLGAIAINQAQSIYEARNKIRQVAENLTDDTVVATRLATAASEMARILLREASSPRIDVELEITGSRCDLALTFAGRGWSPRTELLERFFDVVSRPRRADDEDSVRVSSHLQSSFVPDHQRLTTLADIVQMKGRDELMVEIQSTNTELEHHRDHLEHIVRERTAQLEDAMDEAKSANVAKSQFLANMSHELRTPMNAIIGYTEILIEEAEDLGEDGFIPDLKKIHSAGTHLLALINDVLDLSKIEAGKMELFCETFEVRSLIEDVATTADALVKKNSNKLILVSGDEVGSMYADETKVRQTLFNLLSNACKFTHNGSITLTTSREASDAGDWVLFSVADTGIGVPADKLDKLFQEFTQADASTTRKYGGTGLGLSITRHFCDMMGGSIEVESAVGEGTVFTVRLPADVLAYKGPEDAPADPVQELN